MIFPLKPLIRQGCPVTPVLFNIVSETVANVLRPEKERKDIYLGQKERKLCSDVMVVYVENLTECTEKLRELIFEVGKIAGYKVKIQKLKFTILFVVGSKCEALRNKSDLRFGSSIH